MTESTLLVVFISFAALLLIIALVLRKMSVRDIFDDISSTPKAGFSPSLDKSPFSVKPGNSIGEKSAFRLDRKTINNIGKVLTAIGAIMLFAPLPELFTNLGIGIAVLGYLVAKATAPPKKNTDSENQSPTAQKIRQLATKPEYQEAIKLLFSDLKNNSLTTEEEKYRRSVQYLQQKGIPSGEAKENLKLLTSLLNRQRN